MADSDRFPYVAVKLPLSVQAQILLSGNINYTILHYTIIIYFHLGCNEGGGGGGQKSGVATLVLALSGVLSKKLDVLYLASTYSNLSINETKWAEVVHDHDSCHHFFLCRSCYTFQYSPVSHSQTYSVSRMIVGKDIWSHCTELKQLNLTPTH